MPKNPKVSVIVTCYNLGKYLEEAINSVLNQTFQDIEIIIVNDGSTDKLTNELLADYKKPKTRVISTKNRGLAAARNRGVRDSAGEYVCCLDADDAYEPLCFEKCCEMLDADQSSGFVAFWYRLFGAEEGEVREESVKLEDFLVTNRACGASMFRRKAFDRINGYDASFKGYEDWDFWLSMLEGGYHGAIIKEVLFNYRIRPESMVHSCDKPEATAALRKKIVEKHAASYISHAIRVICRKDELLGEYRYYWKCEEAEAKRLKKHHAEAHRYIDELKAEWDKLNSHFLEAHRCIDTLKAECAEREYAIKNMSQDLQQKQEIILAREDELRSLYASKVWLLGVIFKEARHSMKAFLLLPFRIVALGFPKWGKRS